MAKVRTNNGCVYIATNLNNGKVYIGKTIKSLKARKTNHLSSSRKGSNLYFHRAIAKHGSSSFEWKSIYFSNDDHELCEKEKEYIKLYGSDIAGIGYNLTKGGDGASTGSYGYIIIQNLASQYEEVSSLFSYFGKMFFDKFNKPLKPGKAPFIFKVIITLDEIMKNMEIVFKSIDDKNAKYHVDGYYKGIVKAGSNG